MEGQNIDFEVRLAKGKTERLPELAAELVWKKPDLLYCAMGPEAAGRSLRAAAGEDTR